MIRGITVLLGCFLILSACANGKAVKSTTIYAPAEFQITDVTVDVPDSADNREALSDLMRVGAANLALAYNDNMPLIAPEYVMEISVQSYKASSTSSASLRYRAIIRDPRDGTEIRALPVGIANTRNIVPEDRLEKGLIENSLPEAFYRLYGLVATPVYVSNETAGEKLFVNPITDELVTSRARPIYDLSPPVTVDANIPASDGNGGEPSVVTCDVC